MRKIYILLLACPLLSLFVACNDNDYKASVTELRLVLVKPTNVYSGEIATILGRNFSTVPEEKCCFHQRPTSNRYRSIQGRTENNIT
ncbi:hypothetical protein [Bacteroides xylanisolvens]|uniref:hypothetical protein n=1 Tax=Bacteroides xylanisolvens TaxID=371601 RepID=UPI001F01BD72|nr:hypothetical protein [Bacteroides xylanisolvens]